MHCSWHDIFSFALAKTADMVSQHKWLSVRTVSIWFLMQTCKANILLPDFKEFDGTGVDERNKPDVIYV